MRSLGKLKLLGIFIPFFAIFLMSQNTFAAAVTTNSFGLLYGDSGANWQLQRGIYYGFSHGISFNKNMYGRIQDYDWLTPVISLEGNSASIHFETNIVASFWDVGAFYNPWTNLEYLTVKSCGSRTINTQSIATAVTYWTDSYNGGTRHNYTLTVYGDVSVTGFPSGTSDDVRCTVSAGDTYFFNVLNYGGTPSNTIRVWFEQNPMNFYWSNSVDNSLLQTQINQNNTIINQNQQMIDQNNQAVDNISGQSSSDVSGAENQATTNLVGVLSSFLTQLQGFSATNCNLVLPFPQFIGGTQTVNICQGKDVLGNFITVIGTLAMVTFYIPLAYMLLKMIYNEIRSFTNG